MINPLTAQLLPPVGQRTKTTRTNQPTAPATSQRQTVPQARPSHSGLAASIAADGGLGFLQARLEEKMGVMFEKAAEKNPDLAAAGPEAFFTSSSDVTPEATAGRIVGFALGLRGIFNQQNSDLSEDELMTRFEAEIRQGISDGFGHARGVLGGLEMLEGEVAENVDSTWDLVQQKLADYFNPDEAE